MTNAYLVGCSTALHKLGMQLQFNSPEEAAAHQRRRDAAQNAVGFAGDMFGGTVGAAAGSAVGGPAGTVVGGLAGGYLGGKALAAPVTTAMDAAHDVNQRTTAIHDRTLGRLNAAAGIPGPRMPQNMR